MPRSRASLAKILAQGPTRIGLSSGKRSLHGGRGGEHKASHKKQLRLRGGRPGRAVSDQLAQQKCVETLAHRQTSFYRFPLPGQISAKIAKPVKKKAIRNSPKISDPWPRSLYSRTATTSARSC